MSTSAVLALLCLVLFLSSPSASSATADKPSAYDVLSGYNFPVGLLPKGISRYELDQSSGRFHAYLDGTCSFSLEGSYQLRYKSTISGRISQNKLTDLRGISVKILFLWMDIVEVTRAGDDLEFSIGIASADFPIENFYESPQCGCGLNCNGIQVSKLRANPFVSDV